MYVYRDLPKEDDPASEGVEAEPVKQTLSSGWQAARFLVWWKVQQGLVDFLAPDTLQLGKCLKVRSLDECARARRPSYVASRAMSRQMSVSKAMAAAGHSHQDLALLPNQHPTKCCHCLQTLEDTEDG